MHAVEDRGLLVVWLAVLVFKDFSLVEKLMMEAKSALVLGVSGNVCRSHLGNFEWWILRVAGNW